MLVDRYSSKSLRRQALASLSHSFDSFYEYTIATDEKGVVTWISEAYAQFLAVEGSAIDRPITDIIPSSFIPSVIETGEPVFLDLLFIREQWVVISVIPLKDNDGNVIGAFGFVATDSISPLLSKYNQLQQQLTQARDEISQVRQASYGLAEIVGRSTAMVAVKKQLRQAARFDISVLLSGETGTGKELFAHALHELSARSQGAFVGLNVAAIPADLLEAELFGFVAGAFTGASRSGRVGKFELADGGTLFLDEIGDMSLPLQAKLLRVLQEKEFEPVGSNELKKTDIRLVAATSRDLLAMVERGEFRADLYYRLNALPIHLPPLRQRLADIELLSEHFVGQICARLGLPQKELSHDALQLLAGQSWPGNARELNNLLERACVLNKEAVINAALLVPLLTAAPHQTAPAAREAVASSDYLMSPPQPLAEAVAEVERSAISKALVYTRGRKVDAAKLLGISRANLYAKMRKLGL